MKIEKLENPFKISSNNICTLKRMGNITEVRVMAREPKPSIKKLDKESYVDLGTRRN